MHAIRRRADEQVLGEGETDGPDLDRDGPLEPLEVRLEEREDVGGSAALRQHRLHGGSADAQIGVDGAVLLPLMAWTDATRSQSIAQTLRRRLRTRDQEVERFDNLGVVCGRRGLVPPVKDERLERIGRLGAVDAFERFPRALLDPTRDV